MDYWGQLFFICLLVLVSFSILHFSFCRSSRPAPSPEWADFRWDGSSESKVKHLSSENWWERRLVSKELPTSRRYEPLLDNFSLFWSPLTSAGNICYFKAQTLRDQIRFDWRWTENVNKQPHNCLGFNSKVEKLWLDRIMWSTRFSNWALSTSNHWQMHNASRVSVQVSWLVRLSPKTCGWTLSELGL